MFEWQEVKWTVQMWVRRQLKRLGILPQGKHLSGRFEMRCFDKDHNLIWEDGGPNMLHDGGEKFMLEVCFSEEDTVPANYYLGLDARASLAEADVMTDLASEPSTNGYARQPVASSNVDYTIGQISGDWQAKTKTVTFSASGGSWGPVTKIFLCEVETGQTLVLIASNALSQSRTLEDGQSIECSHYIRLSE